MEALGAKKKRWVKYGLRACAGGVESFAIGEVDDNDIQALRRQGYYSVGAKDALMFINALNLTEGPYTFSYSRDCWLISPDFSGRHPSISKGRMFLYKRKKEERKRIEGFNDKLKEFGCLLEVEVNRHLEEKNQFQRLFAVFVSGRRYTKVDLRQKPESGVGGKFMVEDATGKIFGIKGYGQVHMGYKCGTLDTISEYDWSECWYKSVPTRRP